MLSTLSGIMPTSKTPHKQACKQGARIDSDCNDVDKNCELHHSFPSFGGCFGHTGVEYDKTSWTNIIKLKYWIQITQ